jgi:hypothetical protein
MYDTPQRERYEFFGNAFGATTASWSWQGPPGKKGFVRDILVRITAAMVGTTSVPEIRVGTAASDNSFARFLLGTTAILGYAINTQFRARSLCINAQGRTGGNAMMLNDFAHHICLEGNDGSGTVSTPVTTTDADVGLNFLMLPADTAFFITGVAGVGGTPAGTADVLVDIEWY